MNSRTLILEIRGNSFDDGPGIRSVLFFKGCPLSCLWCHNPESKSAEIEISFQKEKCIACDQCINLCPQAALSRSHPFFVDRKRCNLCMECAIACPSEALAQVGREMSVEEVVEALLKDKPFYDESGGGVTLSGGEPTLHLNYVSLLAKRLKEKKIHTLLETCGYFDLKRFRRYLYPSLDTIYFDVKIVDEKDHKRFCGRGNRLLLENFTFLYGQYKEGGVEVLPRVPLVPGITDTAKNIDAIVSLFREIGVVCIRLIPYHPIWQDKIRHLGIATADIEKGKLDSWISEERIRECEREFHAAGIDTC